MNLTRIKNKLIHSIVILFIFTIQIFCLAPQNAIATCTNGIMNNGTGGIYIDINSDLYNKTWANKKWAAPYKPGGCTWFVGARVAELTNNPKNTTIYDGTSWWSSYGTSLGYSKGTTLNRTYKAVACWRGAKEAHKGDHVAIIEDVKADGTIIVSEGGLTGPTNNPNQYVPWGCCQITATTESTLKNRKDKVFLGYIYLDVKLPTAITGSEMTAGGSQVLPDGDYIIANASYTGKPKEFYLDFEGTACPASINSKAIITGPVLNDDIPAVDVWTLTYLNNGFYKITQKGTDRSLNVTGASVNSGALIQAYSYADGKNEQWAIYFNGNNGYQVQARHSGFCLDIAGGTLTSGASIQQSVCNGTGTQSWLFIPYIPAQPIENGRYIIVSDVDEHLMLDVPGETGDIEENTKVQIWHDTENSRYNAFDFTKLSNGYYTIIHHESGKALEVFGGGSTTTNSLSLHTPNNRSPQYWAVIPNGDSDGYELVVQCSGYAMDLAEAATTD